MKSSIIYLAISALGHCKLPARSQDDVSGFLHVPVYRQTSKNDAWPRELAGLSRRASDSSDQLDLELDNVNNTYYRIAFDLGTPSQSIALDLDTGSSDVWVFTEDACEADDCDENSLFNPDKSSTFEGNGTRFVALYGDGTGAKGVWAQDVMQLGDTKINNFNFGVANYTTSGQGVAGIGLPQVETPYILGDIETTYLNLPQQLKAEGAIRQAAYSLWLNQKDEKAGSILFGAVDHAKYNSDLYVLPLVHSTNKSQITDLAVRLTGLSVYNGKGDEQPFVACSLPAVLDSGTTTTHLPIELVTPILTAMIAENAGDGYFLVDCDDLAEGGLGIQLGGVDITLNFADISRPVYKSRTTGTQYCLPGFIATDEPLAIIGDNFLQHLYVVYDLENLQVGIAAAETGGATSTSSIEVLSTGIPGKTAATDTNLALTYATASITVLRSSSVSGVDSYGSASTAFSAPDSSESVGFQTSDTETVSIPKTVTESFFIGANSRAASVSARPTSSSDAFKSSTVRGNSGVAAGAGGNGAVDSTSKPTKGPSSSSGTGSSVKVSSPSADNGNSKSVSSRIQSTGSAAQTGSVSSEGAVVATSSFTVALASFIIWLL